MLLAFPFKLKNILIFRFYLSIVKNYLALVFYEYSKKPIYSERDENDSFREDTPL